MPGTATITRDLRSGIYELVRNHLGSVGDLWLALEQDKDFAVAEQLGMEFGEDFRLLRDIGWNPSDGRQSVALTMPVHDLMELLERLQDEAERVLVGSAGERKAREEDAETNQRFQLGHDACEKLLSSLRARGSESA